MKKIVLMCGSALTNGGGVIAVTKNLLEYPSWNDYEIIYVATHINGSNKEKVKIFFDGFRRIKSLVKTNNVVIAHLHTCDGGPFYRKGLIVRYLKRKGISVVLHHHTDYTEFFSSLKGVRAAFVKKTIRMSDVNIVLGKNLVDTILKFEPTANVRVVYNGVVPFVERNYNKDGKYILFMGWLLERKGVLDLVKAIKLIDDKLDRRYHLALCGFGDEIILKKIEDIGVQERIGFIGWADTEKKDEVFQDAVVNVLPSYREGAPMTILEAMAYGIPCIASSISTIPEIIVNEENGILIKTHDPREIGEQILNLLNNEFIRERMSVCAYESIKSKFSVEMQCENIKKIYDEMVAK